MYSRITGYYRPVQNWNDGKAEEFKHRKLYDIANSHLRRHGVSAESAEAQPAAAEDKAGELLLFTTKTCPNCKLAKAALDKAGVAYTVVDAEENTELTDKYGVRQAPTLVSVAGDSFETFANASNIKAFAERA